MSDVTVTLDNRARLVGAVLAASTWPQREQAAKPHAVHPQAKLTRAFVGDFPDHPAVITANDHLAADRPVADLYSAAMSCSWPTFEVQTGLPAGVHPDWPEQLMDFYTDTAIAAFFWADHEAVWQKAAAELAAILAAARPGAFWERMLGATLPAALAAVPNLSYPALTPVLAVGEQTLTLMLPPPPAWGESLPWPYSEGTEWVLVTCGQVLANHLLAPALAEASAVSASLWQHAATALFLEESQGEGEAQAYLLRTKKEAAQPGLPALVERLRSHTRAEAGGSLAHFIEAHKE